MKRLVSGVAVMLRDTVVSAIQHCTTLTASKAEIVTMGREAKIALMTKHFRVSIASLHRQDNPDVQG